MLRILRIDVFKTQYKQQYTRSAFPRPFLDSFSTQERCASTSTASLSVSRNNTRTVETPTNMSSTAVETLASTLSSTQLRGSDSPPLPASTNPSGLIREPLIPSGILDGYLKELTPVIGSEVKEIELADLLKEGNEEKLRELAIVVSRRNVGAYSHPSPVHALSPARVDGNVEAAPTFFSSSFFDVSTLLFPCSSSQPLPQPPPSLSASLVPYADLPVVVVPSTQSFSATSPASLPTSRSRLSPTSWASTQAVRQRAGCICTRQRIRTTRKAKGLIRRERSPPSPLSLRAFFPNSAKRKTITDASTPRIVSPAGPERPSSPARAGTPSTSFLLVIS